MGHQATSSSLSRVLNEMDATLMVWLTLREAKELILSCAGSEPTEREETG